MEGRTNEGTKTGRSERMKKDGRNQGVKEKNRMVTSIKKKKNGKGMGKENGKRK